MNTYNYNLASYLVRILQPISTNNFTIKDSFSFADWAKAYPHNQEVMCSFDVSSLFTNVPLDETIQICLEKLYALPDPPTLPRHVLKVLLEYVTKKSHFIFDGDYYDQIDGVAMGSPLGPVLANIFMCYFEEKWITQNSSRPTVWFRYVDDVFTLFKTKDSANRFLQFLNNCHKNIKFTIEFEENGKIPFLDILLKRTHQNNFSTSIYRKKTFTGLYTKWDSFTPRKYKINLIRTVAFRCFRICSSPFLLKSSLDDLRKLLLQNGYPVGIVNYNINDMLKRQQQKAERPPTVPKKTIYIVLPYLGFQSKVITRQLKCCISKFYGCIDLRVIFHNTHNIKSFFPYKDRLARFLMSKVG